MRILFFGDGLWAIKSLHRLLKERWEISGLVLRVKPTDVELGLVARSSNIPLFQPSRVNAPVFIDQIERLRPDLNLSVSYDQILRKEVIESAPLGFINFHAGKLPFYRGRNVINWAIINNEKEIGITAHYIDEGIDTGDIILQHSVPLNWDDTYGTMLEKIINAIPDLVSESVRLIAENRVERLSQAGLQGTYFAQRGEGDEWLNWGDTSLNLYNKIRAITRPGPGARTLFKNEIMNVWRAFYEPTWPRYIATPGQVVGNRPGQGSIIKTGDSTLLLQEIQMGNRNPEQPRLSIGTRFISTPNNEALSLYS